MIRVFGSIWSYTFVSYGHHTYQPSDAFLDLETVDQYIKEMQSNIILFELAYGRKLAKYAAEDPEKYTRLIRTQEKGYLLTGEGCWYASNVVQLWLIFHKKNNSSTREQAEKNKREMALKLKELEETNQITFEYLALVDQICRSLSGK